VFIKSLQPNTQFHYVTGNDGNSDPCKVKSWRTIEYSADGRADSITYDTDVGDMGHLHAVIGQEGSNPLQVPDHLKVCQASNDECFQQIHRFKQCTIAGVDYDYCTTSSADATVYVEAYHEKTHLALNFCAINQTVSDHDSCTRAGARQGIFVKLNTAHTDMGYHYDTGFGFLTINSEKHTDDGSADDGANQGVNGFVRVINHDSVAEYINLNFGYDPTQGSEWDAPSSTFDNSYGVITFAAPLVGTHVGDASCVNPAYGPSWSESDSYFHVILRTAGNSENDLGDNLTNLECGLF
jgi:hypothetical protein